MTVEGGHRHGALVTVLLCCLVMAIIAGSALARTPAVAPSGPVLDWSQVAPPIGQNLRPWRWIVVHHSQADRGSTTTIDHAHRSDNGWEGIGYHFVVGNGVDLGDGRIEATFRWRLQRHGAHAGSEAHNRDGIGVCLIGDLDAHPPTTAQWRSLVALCTLLVHHLPGLDADRILGMRELPGAGGSSPGRRVDLGALRAAVKARLRQG